MCMLELRQKKMYEGIIRFLTDGGLLFFSLSLTLYRNLQSAWTYQAWKNIWMESWETQKNKKVLFTLCYLESSLFRNLHSVWNVPPSSKLLHFFFSVSTSPPHKSSLTNACFFSHKHRLSLSLAPLFPHPHHCTPSFLSPPLSDFLFFLFTTGCSHQPAHQPKSFSVRLTLIKPSNQNFPVTNSVITPKELV